MHQVDEERRELGVELGPSTEAFARRDHRRTGLQVLEEDLVEDVALALLVLAGFAGHHAKFSRAARPSASRASTGRCG